MTEVDLTAGLRGPRFGLAAASLHDALRRVAEEGPFGPGVNVVEGLGASLWAPPAIRAEALGHAMLARVERGELDQALRLANADPGDRAWSAWDRTREAGVLLEVLRTSLALLVPGRVEARVVRPERLHATQGDHRFLFRRLDEFLAALRVLEAANGGNASEVEARWRELNLDGLHRSAPAWLALVHAGAATVSEELREQLRPRLARLSGDARTMVHDAFPGLVGDPYRD